MTETIITPPDIAEALADHKLYNDRPNHWARLDMAQFPHMRNVMLSVGNQFLGFKTIPTFYIYYTLQKDGSVYKTHQPAL